MSEVPAAVADRSPLRVGALMTLAALGCAALIGVIAVIDADGTGTAVGVGVGTAVTIFVAGGTVACALACLARRRVELIALGGIAASGLAMDLFALAIWREIDDETYGKIAGIAFVWTFFGLLMLGLTLAVQARGRLARALFIGAMVASGVAGLIASWLIATNGGAVFGLTTGFDPFADESLLRPLAVALVLLSTLWFGALAASRLERD
ncbi:MAG: hypothetical protein ACRDOF_01605 [Gaiellaceae bacterium]